MYPALAPAPNDLVKPRSERTIRNKCLTGGRPPYPVDDDVPLPVSPPLAEVGERLADADACALPPDAAAPAPPPDPPPPPDACEEATVWTLAAGLVCPRPTTISGALARVATLVPPTSEPTITPNPSIPITAAAAARGPGSANCSPRGAGAGSRTDWARGAPGGIAGVGPCSRNAPIRPAICAGNGPRRAPHSRQ